MIWFCVSPAGHGSGRFGIGQIVEDDAVLQSHRPIAAIKTSTTCRSAPVVRDCHMIEIRHAVGILHPNAATDAIIFIQNQRAAIRGPIETSIISADRGVGQLYPRIADGPNRAAAVAGHVVRKRRSISD